MSYQVGLVACATVNYMLSLEFASFLPNSWKLHGTESNFKLRICFKSIYFPVLTALGNPDGVNFLIPITDSVVITGCRMEMLGLFIFTLTGSSTFYLQLSYDEKLIT